MDGFTTEWSEDDVGNGGKHRVHEHVRSERDGTFRIAHLQIDVQPAGQFVTMNDVFVDDEERFEIGNEIIDVGKHHEDRDVRFAIRCHGRRKTPSMDVRRC